MALDPLELGVIGVVILVMFIWGPNKIPEIARAIGRARKEFESATKEFQGVAQSLQSPTSSLDAFVSVLGGSSSSPQSADNGATAALATNPSAPALGAAPSTPPMLGSGPASTVAAAAAAAGAQPSVGVRVKTGDQILIETARRLGISTQGKTREQIQDEIIAMASRSSSSSAVGADTDPTNAASSG